MTVGHITDQTNRVQLAPFLVEHCAFLLSSTPHIKNDASVTGNN